MFVCGGGVCVCGGGMCVCGGGVCMCMCVCVCVCVSPYFHLCHMLQKHELRQSLRTSLIPKTSQKYIKEGLVNSGSMHCEMLGI